VFPAAIEDGVAIYRWLLSHGYKAEQIVMAGDSAGGALVTSVPLASIKQGLAVPGAAVSLAPWCDLTNSGESIISNSEHDTISSKAVLDMLADRFAAGASKDDALMSPLFADNLHEMPPTWISCGGYDTLRDNGERLAEKASKAGAEVVLEVHEGQQHVFEFMVGRAPEADDSVKRIGEWVRGKIGS